MKKTTPLLWTSGEKTQLLSVTVNRMSFVSQKLSTMVMNITHSEPFITATTVNSITITTAAPISITSPQLITQENALTGQRLQDKMVALMETTSKDSVAKMIKVLFGLASHQLKIAKR